MNHLIDGEIEVIENYIHSNDLVFDIGAFDGDWSREVYSKHEDVTIYGFEPHPVTYQQMCSKMEARIKEKSFIPNNVAVSDETAKSILWQYPIHPALSSIHKRNEKEMEGIGEQSPKAVLIKTVSLDVFCSINRIEYVNFVKIDTEGNEYAVLKGARNLLNEGRIGAVQFEYGRCYLDAKTTLRESFALLLNSAYKIGKVTSKEIQFCTSFEDGFEQYDYCNYLAVKI